MRRCIMKRIKPLLLVLTVTPILLLPVITSAGTDFKESGSGIFIHPRDVDIIISNPLPPTLFATVDVNCPNGGTFTISTGDKGGECATTINQGQVTGGICNGPSGSAQVTCPPNSGQGACISATGSGSCTKK